MKVRLGNDVKLNLTLKGPIDFTATNIKSIRCYLINTTVEEFDVNSLMCPHRYPGKGCNMCHGGIRCYCGHCGYFAWPEYGHWYKPWCGKLCHDHVPCNPAFGEGPLPPKYNDFTHPLECNSFRFLCDSRVLPGKNRIQTIFPADKQKMCGDYKLIVVVEAYEEGWGKYNIHTFTDDYGTVVTLVDDDSADVEGGITIDVDNNSLDGVNRIGFLDSQNVEEAEQKKDDKEFFQNVYNIPGKNTVQFVGDNKYLWILTSKPLFYGDSSDNCLIVGDEEKVLTNHGNIDGIYYYHCPDPFAESETDEYTTLDVTVAFDHSNYQNITYFGSSIRFVED